MPNLKTGGETPAMHFIDSQESSDAVAKERSQEAGDDATKHCREEQQMWSSKTESGDFDAEKGELTEETCKSNRNQESNTCPEKMQKGLQGNQTAIYASCSPQSSGKPKGKWKWKSKRKKSSQDEQPNRDGFSLTKFDKPNKNPEERETRRGKSRKNVIEDLRLHLEAQNEMIQNDRKALDRLTKNSEYWSIERDEVHVSQPNLNSGTWGKPQSQDAFLGLEGLIQTEESALGPRLAWSTSLTGKFRGCPVAVKQIHDLVLTPQNRPTFELEMSIASRCRHPNLVQFIGATNDDRSPLFITELLDTNLRSILAERPLIYHEGVCLALDIARGLNYLHLNKPLPILHRDISSSNVFLWKLEKSWRAKLSYYGAANFMRENLTANPEAWMYSAPENQTNQQTTKVDVYSFGILLCEMCTRETPDPPRLKEQINLVSDDKLRNLIERCVNEDPQARPTMSVIIDNMEEFQDAS